MLWSVNRCGVFPKVKPSSALLLEPTSLEEDCLAAQCRRAVKSCQLSVGDMEDSPGVPAHNTQQQGALQGTQQVTRAFVELHQYTINTTVRAGAGCRCVPAGTVCDSLC